MSDTPETRARYPTASETLAHERAGPERDLLGMRDFGGDLEAVLDAAVALKTLNKRGHPTPLLAGKSAVMIFEKSSTRTRVSFEVGLAKLGATAVFLSTRDIQMGRGESIEDTAFVLSRYADALVYRAHRATDVKALADAASVPVVNALDDAEHPCQIAADLLTVLERKGRLAGLRFLYVGDGNNMCHSYLVGCAMAGMHVTVATPPGYEPDLAFVEEARSIAKATGGSVRVQHGIEGAFAALDDSGRPRRVDSVFRDQDVVATDTWVSMGDEDEKEARLRAFKGYTVTEALMAEAAPGAIFLHCLPAYYGYEVEKAVAHGPQSAVFDEAENRLWAQMAILVWLLAPWKLRKIALDAASLGDA